MLAGELCARFFGRVRKIHMNWVDSFVIKEDVPGRMHLLNPLSRFQLKSLPEAFPKPTRTHHRPFPSSPPTPPGMEGIQGVWRFSAKAGCQKLVIESRVLYASAMAMVVLAHFSLKTVRYRQANCCIWIRYIYCGLSRFRSF